MQNIIYSGWIKNVRGSDDETYSVILNVTEENNGYACFLQNGIWFKDPDGNYTGKLLLLFFDPICRDRALERAVAIVEELRRCNNFDEVTAEALVC